MKTKLFNLRSTLLFLLAVYINTSFAQVGAECNPTGNPIGGGAGYSDSVTIYNYLVTNKTELLSALSSASNGDIIYIIDHAEIDMTGERYKSIPAGVTLASGRGKACEDTVSQGALIYTNDIDDETDPLFYIGEGSRVSGLRLRGPFWTSNNDSFPVDGFNTDAIRSHNPDTEIDNCEFWGWSHAAIECMHGSYRMHVHHNYIHNNQHSGHGYGVTVGSILSDSSDVLIEANLFEFSGHHAICAAGDSTSSYEARYNICCVHGEHHSIDRHGTPHEGGAAGRRTIIHHNTIRNTSAEGICIRGTPTDSCIIYNNWFYMANQDSAVWCYTQENVEVYNNHYGPTPPQGTSEKLPVAIAHTNLSSGVVPLQVSFNGTGSYDPDGNITTYYWDFGDGLRQRGSEVSHTFNEVGRYNVELTVIDNDGIPMKNVVTVTVYPQSGYHLSLWVKDRYHDSGAGYYYKQVFIDTHLIWEDDVAGDEGWVHIVEDVTEYVDGRDAVTIALQVSCVKDKPGDVIREFHLFWDDVALFWASVENGDFETIGDWEYSEHGVFWEGRYHSHDCRSGNTGFRIRYPMNYTNNAGNWARIEQTVAITGIAEKRVSRPLCQLSPPIPNPSNHGVGITYQLSVPSVISIKLYDSSGRIVRTLVQREKQPGYYHVYWDRRDDCGNQVAGGVYFYKFVADPGGVANPVGNADEANVYSETAKVVILK